MAFSIAGAQTLIAEISPDNADIVIHFWFVGDSETDTFL